MLFAFILACGSGTVGGGHFGKMACEHEPWDWYNDPVQSLLEADKDGAFDFDPPGELVTRRSGRYDFDNGDLSWSVEYLSGYYGTGGSVAGYGTIFDDGDLDLVYLSSLTDVLGETSWSRVRTEREGCQETMKLWTVEEGADVDTTPADDPFVWSIEIRSDDEVAASASQEDGGTLWSYTRVWTSDLRTVTRFSTDDGSAEGETILLDDGTGSGSQEFHDGDWDQYYQLDYALDGARRIRVEAYPAGSSSLYQECDYTVSYAGEGQGTCNYYTDQGDFECTLEFDAQSCVLDCGSAGTYDC